MLILAPSFLKVSYRARQANNGLIGKLHITSEMDDNDVTQDIRSVFKHSMWNDHLPPAYTGGGSKQYNDSITEQLFGKDILNR